MTDDFEWMDQLQREANSAIKRVLPMEPCTELREETCIADPPDDPPVADIDETVAGDVSTFEPDPFDLDP